MPAFEIGVLTAIGVVKVAKDFVEAAKSVSNFDLSLTSLMGHGTDSITTGLSTIAAELDALQDLNLAAWATERNDKLAFLRAHSSTALQTIYAFRQSGLDRSHPDWSARLALADRDSLLAVQTFTSDIEDGFWLRPYSLKAISWAGDPRHWMKHVVDRVQVDPLGRVWDYSWAFPAAVYAIMARIGVMRFMTDPSLCVQDLKTYNNFVAKVLAKREGGIKSLDVLSHLQIQRIPTHMLPFAAVDLYGGYFVAGEVDPFFPPDKFDKPPYPPEIPELPLPRGALVSWSPDIENNIRNHSILAKHFHNYVAIKTGLPEILQFAGALENLMTEVQGSIWQPSVGVQEQDLNLPYRNR